MRENVGLEIDTAKVQALYSNQWGIFFNRQISTFMAESTFAVSGSEIKPWGYELLTLDERDQPGCCLF